MISLLLLAYAALKPFPRPSTLEERLATIPLEDLPLERDVVIHWNDHHVPFIEAKADADLPVAIGVVHAHLRLGQLEILKRIALGRIAEMGGPMLAQVDRAIRTLELGRAVPMIEAGLPEDTRHWLKGYVAGVNGFIDNVAELPQEFATLGLKREAWSVADVLTIGRLIAIDVNWLDWMPMLKLRRSPEWQQLWARLVASGDTSLPSFREGSRFKALRRALAYFSRNGSNSFVVSARKSATGSALIANDPHVGLMLPNLWLLCGYHAPSHHAVGLMFPGLPFLGLGRNPRIAWGGTNMHAASSDLYDVSNLPADAFTERREHVKVRWSLDRHFPVRETEFGPVLSDAKILGAGKDEDFALRWVGHDASDEWTPLLKMSQAENWNQFRGVFKDYAVSGMNLLYADVEGNIGQVLAVRLPVRGNTRPADLVLDPSDPALRWDGFIGTEDLPHSFNPMEGFLLSANNRPVEHDVPISFFFSTNDRIRRISELLADCGPVAVEDLMKVQADVFMPSAIELRDILMDKMRAVAIHDEGDHAVRELLLLIRSWDGQYRAASRGALAFELFVHHVSKVYYGPTFDGAKTATYASVGRIRSLLEEDLNREAPHITRRRLQSALSRAAKKLHKFETWGALHRYGLYHPLGALPLLGRRYRFLDHPAPGSSDTVMKSAHGSTDKRHRVGYGAAARHVSDLSDLDANWFVLFGGQDGWFKSTTFIDQVPMWFERSYLQMPLRIETVRATFPHRTVLTVGAARPEPAPASPSVSAEQPLEPVA